MGSKQLELLAMICGSIWSCTPLQSEHAVRDIHLHIDLDRAKLAHAVACADRREVVFSQQFTLALEYDAMALYGCMCHETSLVSGAAAEFFWSTSDDTIVALGHVSEQVPVASFDELATQLQLWRAQCADPTTSDVLRVVGGLAFDPGQERASSDALWRGYDSGKFWIPRCMVRVRTGERWVLTLCAVLSHEMSEAHVRELLRREAIRAEAWIVSSQHHDVSRETSRIEPSMEEPLRERWGQFVTTSANYMRHAELDKVVLARRLEVDFVTRVRPAAVLRRLHRVHPTCTTFLVRPEMTPDEDGGISPRFIGASPECLVRMHSGQLYVDALAGSAPRDVADEVLLHSAKDREEHQLVVDAITHVLRPHAALDVGEVFVDKLSNIKHLRTPVSGRVNAGEGLTTLARVLHPTPAVCGKPQQLALDYLRAHEHGEFLDRGWYTGVVGWLGLDDRSGEFYVALRSALLGWHHATLFVGAGIMPDSEAELELAETRHKGEAIYSAFLGDEAVSDA